MKNGGSRGRQGIFLADKIENQDGHLRFLVSDSDRDYIMNDYSNDYAGLLRRQVAIYTGGSCYS